MEAKLFTQFIGTLLESSNQAHVYHWQAMEEGSYAAHQALGAYYPQIVELADDLVESYQGRYGIIKGFNSPSPYREDNNWVGYFQGLRKYVEHNRYNFTQDSYIQNQVDEIIALIETTLYKLQTLR